MDKYNLDNRLDHLLSSIDETHRSADMRIYHDLVQEKLQTLQALRARPTMENRRRLSVITHEISRMLPAILGKITGGSREKGRIFAAASQEAIEEFIKTFDKDSVHLLGREKCVEICKNCGGTSFIFAADGVYICQKCYSAVEYTMDGLMNASKVDIDVSSRYQKPAYFQEYIDKLLCRIVPKVTPEEIRRLKEMIMKDGIGNIGRMQPEKLDRYIGKIRRPDLYHHRVYIYQELCGRKLPPISEHDIEVMMNMFDEVVHVWPLVKSTKQQSFMNYPYVVRKIIELIGKYDVYIPFIRITNSEKNLRKLDSLWSKICRHCNYQFIETKK